MINVRNKTAQYVEQTFDINPQITEALFDIGLFREDVARRVIIREEYYQRHRTNKKTELKIHLAEKYATSVSTIEKIIGSGLKTQDAV